MKRCLYCQKRTKRYCKAIENYLCNSCCFKKRMIDIICPEDCIYYRRSREQLEDKFIKKVFTDEKLKKVVEEVRDFNNVNYELYEDILERLSEKFKTDIYYEDKILEKALKRLMEKYIYPDKEFEYLLNRQGVLENLIEEEINKYRLRWNISKKDILTVLMYLYNKCFNLSEERENSTAYVNYIMSYKTKDSSNKSNLIINLDELYER